MADKKISALTSATLPLAGTEVLPIVQSSTTVKVATDDLTVKNIRSNATTGILQIAGPGAGATRTMTTPNANFTAARTDAAQSFTGDQTLSTGNLIAATSGKGLTQSATNGDVAVAANGTGRVLQTGNLVQYNNANTTQAARFCGVNYKTNLASGSATDVFTFTKASSSGSVYRAGFAGELIISFFGRTSGGSLRSYAFRFLVNIAGGTTATITLANATVESASAVTSGLDVSCAISLSSASATSATLAVTITQTSGTLENNEITVKLDGVNSASDPTYLFAIVNA